MGMIRALLVVTSLLLTASSAWAECAWVLWNEVTRVPENVNAKSQEWIAIAASVEKAECERSLATKISSLPKEAKMSSTSSNVLRRDIGPKETELMRFICLPDTIDPRGPKGEMR
jgi:hypothetical protein